MVTRPQIQGRMAVGYQPTCMSKPGLWPCYPMMGQFGLPRGLGAVNPLVPRYGGLRGLTFDGTGVFGTGMFGTDPWDWSEWTVLLVGIPLAFFMVYSTLHQAGQTKLRAGSAAKRRRKSRAAKLRERAKRLEAKEGIFGGLLFGG